MNNTSAFTLENLIANGCTKKYATIYLHSIMEENKNPAFDQETLAWAHSKGFLAESVCAWGVHEGNYQRYLSDFNWHKIWPLNHWSRIWINDKTTLKYMLHGTEFGNLLPEYYFYMSETGLKSLMDNPYNGRQDVDTLVQILRDKGAIACKPNNGALGQDFYAIRYNDGYFINGNNVSIEKLKAFILERKNYIYTEYLTPCAPFSQIASEIHTMRIIVMNTQGNNPFVVNSATIRYPSQKRDGANLVHFTSNTPAEMYNIYSHVDISSGMIDKTKLVYVSKTEDVTNHPINNASFHFKIDKFNTLLENLCGISAYLSSIEWMGFDVCMTEKGFKIMEINSHPGAQSAQLFTSLLDSNEVADYLINKLRTIDALSESERQRRALIPR